jgi:hypothetical protein
MKRIRRWANIYQGGRYMTAWNTRAMADQGCDIRNPSNHRVKFRGMREACVEFDVLWTEQDGLHDEEREKALRGLVNENDDSIPDMGLESHIT